jgi:hypothetical protein
MKTPAVAINSISITAPTLRDQVHGTGREGETGETDSDVYTGCSRCEGTTECQVCNHAAVWEPRYTKRVVGDMRILEEHMLHNIKVGVRLAKCASMELQSQILSTVPEAVWRILASSVVQPTTVRQQADKKFVKRCNDKEYKGSLCCTSTAVLKRRLEQYYSEPAEHELIEKELQRRAPKGFNHSGDAQVDVMAMTTNTRQAGRESRGDAVIRSGRTRESAVSLEMGGGLRARRLDLEWQQEQAERQERKRVRETLKQVRAEEARDAQTATQVPHKRNRSAKKAYKRQQKAAAVLEK